MKQKPHLYTKGGEKQYKDYEKNFSSKICCKDNIFFLFRNTFFEKRQQRFTSPGNHFPDESNLYLFALFTIYFFAPSMTSFPL